MPKRNLAWILLIAMITLLMWQLPQTIAGRDAVYKAFGPLADVKAQIRRRFVEEVDEDALTSTAVEAGIKAMIGRIHDPYAVFLNRDDYARFKSRTEGVFGGIGVDVWAVPEGLEVLSRDPGSPASDADILPGDIIILVDGQSVAGLPLVEAVSGLLNGPPGSEVTLTILDRQGKEAPALREVKVTRAVIQIDPIRGWSRSPTGGWRFMLDTVRRIGYVRLTKFTQDAATRLDAVMQRMFAADLQGLILDLRENPGGLLDSAREVADRFLESGLIVRVSGRRSDEKSWSAMRDGTYPHFPMAVLINGSTASAAEIVAGALRDHDRAIVVGERSYGKGSVQEVVELDGSFGAIKLTTAYYYLADGECIHRTVKAEATGSWGVAPTVPVELTPAQEERWRATWRELGRQLVDAPEVHEANGVQEIDDPERERTKELVLEGDIQLRTALSELRALVPVPDATGSADVDCSSMMATTR